MQGALYFPFIAVPETAWLTRTLLYWDRVGTIVPQTHIEDPDLLDPYSRTLIRADLLAQVMPEDADPDIASKYEAFLAGLPAAEVETRRRRLERGETVEVSRDKFVMYATGLHQALMMGLAAPSGADGLDVEVSTAAEFMAALALALCHPDSGWVADRRRQNLEDAWVPTTDRKEAVDALLAGLVPLAGDASAGAKELTLRVRGETRAAEVRSVLLQRLLPVPSEPMDPEQLVAFRRRHGSLLPQLRRHIESLVDEAIADPDEVARLRSLDRLAERTQELTAQAAAYLRESGCRAIVTSPLLRLLKVIPGLSAVGGVQELAGVGVTVPSLDAEPLAYLAFARAELLPPARYRVDPLSGIPLAAAMS